MKHDRHTDSGADELGNAGATDTIAGADLDGLGVERSATRRFSLVFPSGRQLDVDLTPDDRAALGIYDDVDPGEHYRAGLTDADRRALDALHDRADDRARSRRTLVRRLRRAALLRRLSGRVGPAAGRGPAGAVAARRRAGVDLATAELIRQGI